MKLIVIFIFGPLYAMYFFLFLELLLFIVHINYYCQLIWGICNKIWLGFFFNIVMPRFCSLDLLICDIYEIWKKQPGHYLFSYLISFPHSQSFYPYILSISSCHTDDWLSIFKNSFFFFHFVQFFSLSSCLQMFSSAMYKVKLIPFTEIFSF